MNEPLIRGLYPGTSCNFPLQPCSKGSATLHWVCSLMGMLCAVEKPISYQSAIESLACHVGSVQFFHYLSSMELQTVSKSPTNDAPFGVTCFFDARTCHAHAMQSKNKPRSEAPLASNHLVHFAPCSIIIKSLCQSHLHVLSRVAKETKLHQRHPQGNLARDIISQLVTCVA